MQRCTTLALVISLTPTLTAQAMSSPRWFVPSVEMADGGRCRSASYDNTVVLGVGQAAPRMASANYRIPGGFVSTLLVNPGGQPWITGVSPMYATTNGQSQLQIHGIHLDRGSAPTVLVGGKTGAIVRRIPERILVTQPALTDPGRIPVVVRSSLGTTALPRGLGSLPMLECDPAPAPNTSFDIVFRGTQGDLVLWAAGLVQVPPISLGPILHGLTIHPGAMVVLPGLVIGRPDGVLRFRVPATSYFRPLFVQGMFATSNQGYAPGSFTNLLRL